MSKKYIYTSSDDDDIKPVTTANKRKLLIDSSHTQISSDKTSTRTYSHLKSVKRKIESDNESSSDSDYVPECKPKAKYKKAPVKKSVTRGNMKKMKTEHNFELLKDEQHTKCVAPGKYSDEDTDLKPKVLNPDGNSTHKNAIQKSETKPNKKATDTTVDIKPLNKLKRPKKHEEKVDFKEEPGTSVKRMKTIDIDWEEAEVLAEDLSLDYHIARNVVRLLEEDNTIPFIARYRKEMTGNMSPEMLREVKEAYELLKNVKKKAASVLKNIMKIGKLNPTLEKEILSAKSMTELDHISASFKTNAKGTLADRARELGLETPALTLLSGNSVEPIRSAQFVCFQKTKGVASPKEVELGMQHIIADLISKDRGVRDLVRKLKNTAIIALFCTKSKSTSKKEPNAKANKKADSHTSTENESKYQNYFDFKSNTKLIKPHQVLAINRGEKNKILSVKVDVPHNFKNQLFGYVQNNWLNQGLHYPLRQKLVECSFIDAYERLILPLIVRQVRSELTQMAEKASVEVFASNLKNLLLQPPLRGKVIMGLDPGFRNGCKLAITSHIGSVLSTGVIYPSFGPNFLPLDRDNEAFKLKDLIHSYRCETIALGNGTACRETEEYLSRLIQSGWFKPLDVVYTIVSEQGASIYSCSPEAKKEFPELDTNLISAVSIARRLQDPLGEFVKIEARHLGVGMYQHDLPDTKLRSTLDEVVIECVSFVGVDLNAASQCILRRIAGLNDTRAQNIIEWRNSNGPFHNREQVKDVKGIGAKTYEQCAGFVRILPQTCGIESAPAEKKNEKINKGKGLKKKENYNFNLLDSTWIHPESYNVAERIIKRCNANIEEIGSSRFIEKVKTTVKEIGLGPLASEMKISEELTKLVTDGLIQRPDHDLRSEFTKPLFRRGVRSFEDLRPGDLLSGKVRNVTHFGAFVDIGVGRDGLLPSGRLRFGMILPQLGEKVEVQIVEVDIQRRRITLDLVSVS